MHRSCCSSSGPSEVHCYEWHEPTCLYVSNSAVLMLISVFNTARSADPVS